VPEPTVTDLAPARALPPVVARPWRTAAIHGGLFAACCVTTYLTAGPYFAATLMGILLFHEAGHYFVGRYHGVDASLPYFIPLPPSMTLGTLGAVIKMKHPIADRNVLFDVGAAGPIAGLVVALPLLVIGLTMSSLGPNAPGDALEGNSILYVALKYAVFGRYLPGGGIDVHLHPMASAGWVGLLITMINLMPIGQLDGGHIACAALGARHEAWSARLHIALPAIGVITAGVMVVIARATGLGLGDAVWYAKSGLIPWLVWTAMLAWMRHQGGEYHPPVGEARLSPWRRRGAIAMLVVFLLIATPVPFRPAL
jgi:membrane-associated protease RseP (regulator of RpoE activity)